ANSDGTVLFGTHLLRSVLSEVESPDAVVTAVCAHEFGHILQYKKNLATTIVAGQKTAKRLEIHAHFFARFYSGTRKLQKPNYPTAVFGMRALKTGDYDQSAPDHHGRPEERMAAVVRGFEVAFRERRTLLDAIQIGMNHVAAL